MLTVAVPLLASKSERIGKPLRWGWRGNGPRPSGSGIRLLSPRGSVGRGMPHGDALGVAASWGSLPAHRAKGHD